MSSVPYANLRFPVAAGCGLLLTATLFSSLWSLTTATFEYKPISATPIEYSPVLRDTVTERKYQQKVALQPPPAIPQTPQIRTTTGGLDQGPTLPRFAPEVVTTGGIPMTPGADTDVLPLVRIQPDYPPRASRANIEGWVLVQYNVSASGAVTDAVVVASEPSDIFDDATLKAVSRWLYSPKVEGAVAVERRGMQTLIRFNLDSE